MVLRLLTRIPRSIRSEDRHYYGMAVAEWAEVAALCDHVLEGRDLVRRVRHQTERPRALRSEDSRLPELEDSWRRRSGAQHDAHCRREPRDRRERVEHGRAGSH